MSADASSDMAPRREGSEPVTTGKQWAALVAIALVAAIGCDDDTLLTAQARGNLDVRIEDDRLRGAVLRTGGGTDTVFASPDLRYSGVLRGTARVAISEDRRRFHDLGSRRIEVDLQTEGEAEAPAPQLDGIAAPAGRYRVVRLTLREAVVRIDAGSVLRDTVLSGPVELEVVSVDRDRDATVERVVESFPLDAGSRVLLALDLNSHLWITRANVRRGRVSEAALRQGVGLRILDRGSSGGPPP